MLKFIKTITNKLFTLFFSIFIIVSSSFFLLRFLPGNPFSSDRHLAPEIVHNLEVKYGLDKPLLDQYFVYIKKLFLDFDFGPSLKYPNREVLDILSDAMPVSISLGLWALLISVCLGLCFGSIIALNPQSKVAKVITIYSNIAISLPSFVFAGILITIFGLKLNWLPVALWEGPEYIVLPAFTLAIAPTAYITRVSKSALETNLSQTYIQTAIVKGLNKWDILLKHALRPSLLPIITFIGPLTTILITGSFVVEYIFALPGMGKYFVTAFINRDYFLVSGVIVIFAVILVSTNILIEILNPVLNPKLKISNL